MRKYKPTGMELLVQEWLRSHSLGPALNTRLISKAWHQATGAGRYTSSVFYRGGKLYVTTNSSVVRSQLVFQKKDILAKMNSLIAEDGLFTGRDNTFIQELIIR